MLATGMPWARAIPSIRLVQTESGPGKASICVALFNIFFAKLASASGRPVSAGLFGLGVAQASENTAIGSEFSMVLLRN